MACIDTDGAGLGLYQVKLILERFGGAVAHPEARPAAHAAPLADPVGDAVPAPDRHAAPDRDATADDRAHHRAAELAGAHPVVVGNRVRNPITSLAGVGFPSFRRLRRFTGPLVSAAGRPPRTAWAG